MRVWRDCVVSLIDLVGIKKLASGPQGQASRLMRRLHKEVAAEMSAGLCRHAHAYLWNDSVLLLAFLSGSSTPEAVLREVDGLKRTLEPLGESYAISVKGQAFPRLQPSSAAGSPPRATVIEASSYAMANCFLIEEALGKKLRKAWYVDSRLARKIHAKEPCHKEKVQFQPRATWRDVYVYDGYLWDAPNDALQRTGSSRCSLHGR